MNILYAVNDFFPRYYGGVERYVLNISKQMQREGHGVKVLTYGMDTKVNGYRGRGEILYKEYIYEDVPVVAVRHQTIPADIGYRIGDDLLEKGLLALCKEQPIDLIHIAHPMKLNPLLKVAERLNIPTVLTLTDFWLLCPRGRFFKPDYSACNSPRGGEKCIRECGIAPTVTERYRKAREIFNGADALVAPSRFITKIFEQNGWDREIAIVRHGFERQRTVPVNNTAQRAPGTVIFGYTGLITKFKGVDLLVESFKKVPDSSLRLRIYGDIYEEWVWERTFYHEIEKSAKEDSRIQFMGKYAHSDLPEVFGAIDLAVVPSTTLESYGLVVTESLSHNVPVIASDIVGSAYEYIRDGVNGYIFPVNRPERLTGIMESIAENPSVIETLKKHITLPPRIEEEAFMLARIYKKLAG